MAWNEAQRARLLEKVLRLVEDKYHNPDKGEWRASVVARRAGILNAALPEDFERQVHELVSALGSSHTAFYHRNWRPLPTRQSICATLQQCETDQGPFWMFEDVQEEGAAHAAGLRKGDLLVAVDGEAVQPPGRVLLRPGRSAKFRVRRIDGTDTVVGCEIPTLKATRPFSTPRAVIHSTIEADIGYLKINMFPGMVGIDVAKDIDHAIASFENCQRLIVDLRGNSGGGIGCLRLMSYLTPAKLPIGYSLSRTRAQNGYRKEDLKRFERIPSRKIELPWLALRYGIGDHSIALFTEALGPQRFHGRIVMLVNEHSASASEMVAAFAAENKLAKIVGIPTPGRLVGSKAFKVGNGYFLILPIGAYFTWQGTRLEGKGVTPDIEVPLSYQAVKSGRDNQLESAITTIKDL
ncbi:MAG: hypothetical protein LC114_04990 [Bryobacterales bacterium]|nr:hypothetical protein [Bryobacterales bacterium]